MVGRLATPLANDVACQFPGFMLDSTLHSLPGKYHLFPYTLAMKQGIHPTYFKEATIACSCGAVLVTGSTVEKMHTEICSQCHPFYTGKKKFIDATGRVDRFKKLAEKSEAKQVARLKAAKAKKAAGQEIAATTKKSAKKEA